MRKKLHFDNSFRISTSMYILIDSGKIREFEGADFMPLILHGHPQPEFKTFELNSELKLVKISKYDRKKLNIKANYKVDCTFLSGKFMKDSYIKLNLIEKFIIDYSKKESVLHKMNFNQKFIAFVVFGLIGFSASQFFNIYTKTESNIEQIQEENPDLKKINQETKKANIKADSVSIQTTKFERDSLKSD